MKSLALAVLAAGAATRFGAAKQLALIQNQPMLQRAIDQCCRVGPDVFVALGAHQADIRDRLDLSSVEVIPVADWSEGISASIRAVITRLQGNYDAVLLLAGDQPLVGTDQLAAIVDRWRAAPQQICCAQYQDTLGIPAIFPRSFFPDLVGLRGDRGAKALLQDQAAKLQVVDLAEAAVDIDCPHDLDRLPW